MDELVALVVEKTGLSEKQAETAVEVVLDFIKDEIDLGDIEVHEVGRFGRPAMIDRPSPSLSEVSV